MTREPLWEASKKVLASSETLGLSYSYLRAVRSWCFRGHIETLGFSCFLGVITDQFSILFWGGWSRTGLTKVSGADMSICLSIFWHRDGSPATGAMAHRERSWATGAMAQFFVRGRSAHLGAMWRAALSADKHPCPVAAFDSRIRRSFSARPCFSGRPGLSLLACLLGLGIISLAGRDVGIPKSSMHV